MEMARIERMAAAGSEAARSCVNWVSKYAADSPGNLRLISRLSLLHAIDEDGYEGTEIGGCTVSELAEDADDAVAIFTVWEILLQMRVANIDVERWFKEVEIICDVRRDG